MKQVISAKTIDSRWNWLYKISGVAALLIGLLLLLGLISLIASLVQPGVINGWLLLLQNNWLVKIFILRAEFRDIQVDLHGLNLLDIVVLLLVSMICLSLSKTFRKSSKTWSLFALTLSLVAILLFVLTQIAGRSTVMLVVLINSLAMFRDKTISRVTIYMGSWQAYFYLQAT